MLGAAVSVGIPQQDGQSRRKGECRSEQRCFWVVCGKSGLCVLDKGGEGGNSCSLLLPVFIYLNLMSRFLSSGDVFSHWVPHLCEWIWEQVVPVRAETHSVQPRAL